MPILDVGDRYFIENSEFEEWEITPEHGLVFEVDCILNLMMEIKVVLIENDGVWVEYLGHPMLKKECATCP